MLNATDTEPPFLIQETRVLEGNMTIQRTGEEELGLGINKVVGLRPPVKTGHSRLALLGLDPAPTDRDVETGKTPLDILQVIKGFSLKRKIGTVTGSSQGRVAVKSDGDRARIELVDAAEEL